MDTDGENLERGAAFRSLRRWLMRTRGKSELVAKMDMEAAFRPRSHPC